MLAPLEGFGHPQNSLNLKTVTYSAYNFFTPKWYDCQYDMEIPNPHTILILDPTYVQIWGGALSKYVILLGFLKLKWAKRLA